MKKRILFITLIALLCILLLFSLLQLCQFEREDIAQEEQYRELRTLIVEESEPDSAESISKYSHLFALNSDMVGWLEIDGTDISYPVMQTKDNPGYYLNHDFYRKPSGFGVPYVSESCDVNRPSDNILIHGHHIKGGKLFGALMKYKSIDFYADHMMIDLTTRTEHRRYMILAVLLTAVYTGSESEFAFYSFTDALDKQDFDRFIYQCKRLSLYDTGLAAQYGDQLLTLSTCEYSQKNGRLVVVAKRLWNE